MTDLPDWKVLIKTTTCLSCGGGLAFHDSPNEDERVWAHTDKPLAETAGHEAAPDVAHIEITEVDV
jgi:hypothetical protein